MEVEGSTETGTSPRVHDTTFGDLIDPSNRKHGRGHLSVHGAHVGECRSTRLLRKHCAPHVSRFREPSRHTSDRRRPIHTNDDRWAGELWTRDQACAPTPSLSLGVDPDDVKSVRRRPLLVRLHPRGHHGIVRRPRRSCPGLCRLVTRMARTPMEPCRCLGQCPREHVGVGCRDSSRPLVW